MSAEEREAIIVACVEGKTQAEIARTLGRSEHTVRTTLRSEYGRQRKGELLNEVKEAAVTRLRRSAVRAADSWIKQLALADAGERANHLPAKELLTHTGVLDVAAPNVDRSTQVLIQIGGKGIPEEPIEADVVEEHDPAPQLPPPIRRAADDLTTAAPPRLPPAPGSERKPASRTR